MMHAAEYLGQKLKLGYGDPCPSKTFNRDGISPEPVSLVSRGGPACRPRASLAKNEPWCPHARLLRRHRGAFGMSH